MHTCTHLRTKNEYLTSLDTSLEQHTGKVKQALTRAHWGALSRFPGRDTSSDVKVMTNVTQTPSNVTIMHASVRRTPNQPIPQYEILLYVLDISKGMDICLHAFLQSIIWIQEK